MVLLQKADLKRLLMALIAFNKSGISGVMIGAMVPLISMAGRATFRMEGSEHVLSIWLVLLGQYTIPRPPSQVAHEADGDIRGHQYGWFLIMHKS